MILRLPEDVALYVLQKLHARDLAVLECVSKATRELVGKVDIHMPSKNIDVVLPWCLKRADRVTKLSLRNVNGLLDLTPFPRLTVLRTRTSALSGFAGGLELRNLDIDAMRRAPGQGAIFKTSILPDKLETCILDCAGWREIVVDKLPETLYRLRIFSWGSMERTAPIVVEDLRNLWMLDLHSTAVTFRCPRATRLEKVRISSLLGEDPNPIIEAVGPRVKNFILRMVYTGLTMSFLTARMNPDALGLYFRRIDVDSMPSNVKILKIYACFIATRAPCHLDPSRYIQAEISGEIV